MSQKLCSDCKYCVLNIEFSIPELRRNYASCSRTALVFPSGGNSCRSERAASFFMFNHCGKNARFFERKTGEANGKS